LSFQTPSKINPAELTTQDISKIRHAHISDSSNGHFSDILPNTFHQWYEYKKWNDLLDGLTEQDDNNSANFSGFVSLELEACSMETLKHVGTIIA
jgi:hypothetical protein